MKTLAELGIKIDLGRAGEQRVLCPECSHLRRKKMQRCLSVVRDDRGWKFHCWHCDFKGGVIEDIGQRRSLGSVARDKPSDFGGGIRRARYS